MACLDIPVAYSPATPSAAGMLKDICAHDMLAGSSGKVSSTPYQRVHDEPRMGTLKSMQEMAQHRDTIERIAKAFTMV